MRVYKCERKEEMKLGRSLFKTILRKDNDDKKACQDIDKLIENWYMYLKVN